MSRAVVTGLPPGPPHAIVLAMAAPDLDLLPESPDAAALARGVGRLFASLGAASLTEVGLANGRRADVMAIDGAGRVTIVEIKSSLVDFRTDQKWPDYLDYCESFHFAVSATFPRDVLPDEVGIIIADRFGGMVLRPAPLRPMSPARRKALTLRFGLVAAERLRRVIDPEGTQALIEASL